MTSPTPEASTAALATAAAFAAQQEMLRQQLAAAVAGIWLATTRSNDFSDASARRFVAQILPLSLGAQRTMAQLTQASFNNAARPVTPITIAPDLVSGEALRGVDPKVYYERPFKEIRYRLSQGKPLGEALDAGRRRAVSITQTDLQLAHTHTAAAYMDRVEGYAPRSYVAERSERVRQRRAEREARQRDQGPTLAPVETRNGPLRGYRRVLSSNPNHCALCVLASTRRYRRGNLMAIHPGCGCTVAPIFSVEDPGPVLDGSTAQEIHNIIRRDLGDKYEDASGGRLADSGVLYRDIVVTNDHGELGPVLGVRGQHFTGPDGIQGLGHERVNPLPDDSIDDAASAA